MSALEAHAAGCPRCAGEREAVLAARRTLAGLGESSSPALPWDSIGAQLHWKVSAEVRRRDGQQGEHEAWWRRRIAPATVLLAMAAAAVLLWPGPGGQSLDLSAAMPVAPPVIAPAPAPVVVPPTPVPLEGVITLLAGEVTLGGEPLGAEQAVRAGHILATGDGRVHVQFGARASFVLEPHSRLELRAFDDQVVELWLDGAVGVDITRRPAGQRFAVVAAGRRVEVRGTAFHVQTGPGGLEVAVTRGHVAVVDATGTASVPAGSWLLAPAGAVLAGLAARPLVGAELERMDERLATSVLSAWHDASAAREHSALVRVAAPARARVHVDGVPVGTGAVTLRTTPGRHLVAVGGREQWVQIELGTVAEVELAPRPGKVSERAGQVEAQLRKHTARFEVCANRARGQDPDVHAELVVEIDIGADGSVSSVVAVKGLADYALESCLLDVIRGEFTFPAGSRDTVRKSLRL